MELTNPLLHALLVACDQSYNPSPSGALDAYLDSGSADAGANLMPTNWQPDLEGWVVHHRYDDPTKATKGVSFA